MMVIVYINELNINCKPSVGTREVTRNHSGIQLKPELQPASRWNSLKFYYEGNQATCSVWTLEISVKWPQLISPRTRIFCLPLIYLVIPDCTTFILRQCSNNQTIFVSPMQLSCRIGRVQPTTENICKSNIIWCQNY